MPRRKPPAPKTPTKRAYGGGSAFLNADGTWTARLPRDQDGKRRTKRHRTEAAALAWLRDQLDPIPDGPPSPADELLGDYLARWLERREPGLAPQSKPVYRRAVLACGPILRTPLGDLNHTHFQDILAGLQRRGLAQASVATVRAVLATALEDAVPDPLRANPLKRTNPGREVRSQVECWNREQAERVILASAGHVLEPLVRLGIKVGLRTGELLALQWGDLSPDGWLTVRRSQLTRGKVVGPTKSRRERRIRLPLALTDWLLARPRDSIWLVSRPDGQAYGRDYFEACLSGFAAAAKVPRLHPHAACRHTAANLLLRARVPITQVSRILGHHNPGFTLARYSSCMPEDDDLSMAAMDSLALEEGPEGTEKGTG